MAGTNAPSVAEMLAKFSAEELAEFVKNYVAETESVAEANEILSRKSYPEGERTVENLDDLRQTFFDFAAFMSENILVTDPGDPSGKRESTRSDRRQIEIPTPSGSLKVVLTHK